MALKNITTGEIIDKAPTQQLADAGYVPVDTSKITINSLQPATPIKPVMPESTPVPDISNLGVTTDPNADLYKKTAPEEQYSDLQKQIMDLTNQDAGKAAYTNDLNAKSGISDINANIQDLTDQLTAAKNEQAGLVNAYNYTIPNQQQVNAEGRGMTAAGLAPLTASELRKNQIKQGEVASRALSISSLMASYQGKLATAQMYIDQAVKAKYAPIEAQIEALTKNAQMIKDSPEYSIEDKKRADAIIAQNDAKKAQIDQAKADQKDIMTTAADAAKNGADSLTVQKISQAKTPGEALSLAAGFLQTAKTSIQDIGGRKLLIDEITGKTIKDLGTSGDMNKEIINKYPDAGILPTDNNAIVAKKLQNSAIYKKEIDSGKVSFGKIGTDSDGNDIYGFSDTNSKTVVPSTGNGSTMRTDRNNNPTAMTTDVAKSLGLVEGIDYVQGDKFPGNSNLYTARLLGNSIETTIKALDSAANDPNKQAFYTQSGNQRWTYIGMNDAQWLGLSIDEKKAVIAKMYQNEGGDGSLLNQNNKNQSAEDYAALINQGKLKLENVPEKMRNQVVSSLAKMPSPNDDKLQTAAKEKANLIDSLINNSYLHTAVGPNDWARTSFTSWITGGKQNFLAGVQQLVSQETLDTLLNLKKGGGTLGALSDQERLMLQNAATKIGYWAVKDKNGNVTGYNTNQSDFKAELEKIKRLIDKAVVSSNETETQTMPDGTQWQVNSDGTYSQVK